MFGHAKNANRGQNQDINKTIFEFREKESDSSFPVDENIELE